MPLSIELYHHDWAVNYHLLMNSEDDLQKTMAFLQSATRDGNFRPAGGEPYYIVTRAQMAALAQARKTWNGDNDV
jgi:hypothetical protein